MTTTRHYKIVHCGIFNERDNGNFFYGLERKISHGLIQNGHFVYDFSYRDEARQLRMLGMKTRGLKKMNEKLMDICLNVQADILCLAKAEKIDIHTLHELKKYLPKLKIIQWYVDHLQEDHTFFDKLNVVDAFFYANAKDLQTLSKQHPNTQFAFFPNISDPAFEHCFRQKKQHDVIYIARDYKEDVRTQFAELLKAFCDKECIKLKIYASLGEPAIFGNAFQQAVSASKIAINFNRDDHLMQTNPEKRLGASDRMAQFLGCGACTFSPRIAGFEALYRDEKDIVYFDSPEDCFAKIKYYLSNNRYQHIAEHGRETTFNIANAKRVTQFMLASLNNTLSENYEWQAYRLQGGKAL